AVTLLASPPELDIFFRTRCLVPSCECGSRFCRRWQVPSFALSATSCECGSRFRRYPVSLLKIKIMKLGVFKKYSNMGGLYTQAFTCCASQPCFSPRSERWRRAIMARAGSISSSIRLYQYGGVPPEINTRWIQIISIKRILVVLIIRGWNVTTQIHVKFDEESEYRIIFRAKFFDFDAQYSLAIYLYALVRCCRCRAPRYYDLVHLLSLVKVNGCLGDA
ncbi:unnamed protein product, partial [Trichogramma brassicae]